MRSSHNAGFTLVELMVALVTGLLVILGAGQLFLLGMQNFSRIQALSDKQAAVTFASEVLLRNIRRADIEAVCNAVPAHLSISVDDECHYYDLKESGGNVSLRQMVEGNSWEPVVEGFSNASPFVVQDGAKFTLTFHLQDEDSPLVFHAVNRTGKVAN